MGPKEEDGGGGQAGRGRSELVHRRARMALKESIFYARSDLNVFDEWKKEREREREREMESAGGRGRMVEPGISLTHIRPFGANR